MIILMNNLIKLILLLPVLFACNRSESNGEAGYSADNDQTARAEASASEYAPTAASGSEPKSISFDDIGKEKNVAIPLKNVAQMMKEGNITCELDNYATDKEKIRELVNKYGGYISSENEVRESYRVGNDLVIRVSSEKFEALVKEICNAVKSIDSKQITATDVSEEYFDLETRIKTKKEVEKRYVDFLSRAKNIEEVLKVENELRVIREEIEAKEGRLNFLKDRVSFSTINLNIYQNLDYTGAITKKPGFFNKLAEGFSTGWKGILNFLVMLVYLWPLWLIGGGLAFYFFRYRRKKK